MPTQILAVGTGALDSGDVVVSPGNTLAVCLKDAAGPRVAAGAKVIISLKDDAGQFFQVGDISSHAPAKLIVAPGTYRFSRIAGSASCGVFSG